METIEVHQNASEDLRDESFESSSKQEWEMWLTNVAILMTGE